MLQRELAFQSAFRGACDVVVGAVVVETCAVAVEAGAWDT